MGENGNFQRAGTRERNIGLELVRVTEAAAYAAARHMGRGDKIAVDQAAVDAMRKFVVLLPDGFGHTVAEGFKKVLLTGHGLRPLRGIDPE